LRLLTLTGVARYLNVSDSTARKIRHRLPGGVRVNKRILYREDAIREFIANSGSSGSTAQNGITCREIAA